MTLTTLQQQLVLVTEILSLPEGLRGDVVECGCYDAGSSVGLSLACSLTGRRLFICDSFEGLPEPEEEEVYEIHSDSPQFYVWEENEFVSTDGLAGVQRTLEEFGDIEACRFVKGYYADTLKDLDTDSIVLIFEDADLPSSVRDCIQHLWPKLQTGCKFYCHEPWSIKVVGLFYDTQWWLRRLHTTAPGFFGSGGGLDYGFASSSMGFSKKFDAEATRQSGTKVQHQGSRGFEAT